MFLSSFRFPLVFSYSSRETFFKYNSKIGITILWKNNDFSDGKATKSQDLLSGK